MRWYSVVIDCHDHRAQGHWWAETLGWNVVFENDEECAIIAPHESEDEIADLETWMRGGQALVFVPVPEGKTVKNRLHIDLAPHRTQDRDAEIHELVARGARVTTVGEGDSATWTVLADPEGNEFCVLSSRSS